MKRIALSAVFALSVGALATPAVAGPVVLSDPNIVSDVAERVTPSVVTVSSTTLIQRNASLDPFEFMFGEGPRRGRPQYGKGLGSGVVVSDKGYILTNNHVVENAKEIVISTAAGDEYDAEVVGTDPQSDLAVIKIKGKAPALKPMPLGDSSRVRLGEPVLAIGNPLGVGQTVTMGIISAKGRADLAAPRGGGASYVDYLQTDAAINQGNSGGALVNLRGELIGINTMIMSQSGASAGIGFAIPSSMAAPVMKALIEKGKVTRGYLGIGIQPLDRKLAAKLEIGTQHGVILTSVAPGSPAAKAGLAPGDVIVAVGGKSTLTPGTLRNAVAGIVGQPTVIEFYRGPDKRSVTATPIEQPADLYAERGGGRGGERAQGLPAGKLGVQVEPVTPATRKKYDLPRELDHGVIVVGVAPGGAADELGLQPGDVVLEVDRTPVRSAKDLVRTLGDARNTALLVYRDGAAMYLMVER